MGLSDRERTDYIFHAIKHIVAFADELKGDRYFDKVKSEVLKLWPATIGHLSNGAHWILGSSASNQISSDDMSIFSVALRSGFEKDSEYRRSEEEKKKDPNYRSMKERMDDYFDPMDTLAISHLLKSSDEYEAEDYGRVYEIFAWTEQLVYGLRRYRDEYAEQFKDLSNVVASIQGACFPVLECQIYRKAYLLNQICKTLYSQHCDRKGHLRDVLIKTNFHHHLTRGCNREVTMSQLLKWHERLAMDQSDAECMYVAMEIAGRRLHYENQYKELVNELTRTKTKINYWKLVAIFKKCLEDHKKDEEESHSRYGEQEDENHFHCIHSRSLDEVIRKAKKK